MTPFAGWQNFYVVVGSSAGALIGLQFVVMALVADLPVSHVDAAAGAAFATPTIIHFCAVLLLSAALNAPWAGVTPVAVLWALMGLGGVVYEAIVIRRLGRTSYRPEFEDWLFHGVLPFAAYAVLGGAGLGARLYVRESLFAVAGAALLLLFIGIHNAWDAVTYHVYVRRKSRE